MRNLNNGFGYRACILLAVAVSGMFCTAANADVSLMGVQYQEDEPFAEYQCFWKDGDYPTTCGAAQVGANAHVFIKNNGASAVTLDDVTLAGYSLATVLKQDSLGDHVINSIWVYWDNPPQEILDAGEPAWYKLDPASIPAGEVGQVIVRLRRAPTTGTISVGVDTSANTLATTITVDASAPQLANIGFSADLKKIYLTWRRSGGAAPTTVKMDGTDVTSDTVTVGDASINFAVSVYTRSTALTEMSYHVFQGIYSDSKTATGGVRVWVNPFVYGSWGAFTIPDSDYTTAHNWVDTCFDRGINTIEVTGQAGLMDYWATSDGKTYSSSHNYGFINDNSWGSWDNNPRMWFIDDEPDIEEENLLSNFCGTGYKLPCGSQQAATMGMHFIETAESLRAVKNRPTTINMDGSNKPQSWYGYGQLSDCLAIDHYYQPKVRDAHTTYTRIHPLYEKATVIYATALAGSRASEPNPSRQLLYSCSLDNNGVLDPWPFPPPETKRIEAYYAMAGGAKGICYWWFKEGTTGSIGLSGSNNLVAKNPALWSEIGLLGAEIKTLQPYLVTSHPVELDAQGSTNVWVKALARGTDTLILFAVNDNYYNDQYFHGTDTANATVTVALPSWMLSSPSAFEVSRTGISSVSTSQNGGELTLTLGTLSVGKIIVVTVDPLLMMTIRQRYDADVRPGICNFASTECGANTSVPSLVRHPSAQAVISAGTATFSIAADGGGSLTYQWQKNSTNQSDGGHYAGCTTPVLTVSSVDTNDTTNYRCKITNTYGSATSNQAALTITTVNITQHPSAQAVCTGSNATFSVTATGSGTVYYQWQKDSANQANGGHYSGCTTATLTVTGADTNDAAGYRCKVTDSSNTAYSNAAALSIKTASSFSQHPSNQSIEAGGTAVFGVTAAGYGTLTYQWQKDGANLSEAGHYYGVATTTLTVTPGDANDSGNYRCIVTAGCGSATSNQASLTIDLCAPYVDLDNGNFEDWPSGSIAPNWTGAYSDTTSAQFVRSTTARGGSYSQGVKARDLASAWCHVYQGFATSVGDALTITAYAYPTATSAGVYPQIGVNTSSARPSSWLYTLTSFTKNTWCSMGTRTCNAAGTATYLFLDVLRVGSVDTTTYWDDVAVYRTHVPTAPAVTAASGTSLNVNVDPGCNSDNSSAEFAITISGGAYTEGTHWVQANGTVSTTTVWQTDATWGTREVTGLATGTTYTFKTKARYSATYTQATYLGSGAQGTPQSTLSITQHPSAQSVCSGSNASFSVAATGSGTLTYQWQKTQANISNGGHYSGCTTATLAVTGADTTDVANYRCKVTDANGSLNSNEAALSLKSATTVTTHPTAQSVCSGSNASFTVAATGDGTLTYQWQKAQANISNGGHYSGCTTATLAITGADTTDVANYRCKVTGGCGSVNSNEAALSLKTATSITTHPSNQSVASGGTATFSVVGAGDGTLTYQWQKNSSNQANGGHYSGCTTATLTVSTADTNDAANYRCIVTATCGSATSNQATLTISSCITTSLLNGNFEDWPSGSVAPNWTGAYSATVSSQFVRSTTAHGGSYAQGTKSKDTSGSWAHVYQGFATNVGDAITITAYAYPISTYTGLNPQVGVNTSSSRPSSWLSTLTSFTKQTWCSMGTLTCNAAGTTTFLFLESKRILSVDTTTYWDDVVVSRAQVPPAPTVAWASSTSLNVNVDPGCNSTNSNAEYAITVSGGAYTEGTHWVQSGGTVSTTAVWQTDATWGNKTVTGLSTGTTYTFKVKARYSSSYTMPTALGTGATGTP